MSFPAKTHSQAIERSLVALSAPDTMELARMYYSSTSNYSGFLFTQLPDDEPNAITAADLFAASTLSIRFEAVAAKRLIFDAEKASKVEGLFRKLPDVSVAEATDADFEKMSALYSFIKSNLGRPNVKNSNRWVSASKLVARKRPRIFPVRDNVVSTYLGINKTRDHRWDWGVYRSIMSDNAVKEALAEFRSSLSCDRVDHDCLDREPALRLLDVALWTHAIKK
ncbi:DUF6308 family protein [Corynebacterium flavescens]|uniref:DUF6308 family protein n=1 Tax=Corynebacterium flavescens TaxID=28028 RepID=UPI003F92D3D2